MNSSIVFALFFAVQQFFGRSYVCVCLDDDDATDEPRPGSDGHGTEVKLMVFTNQDPDGSLVFRETDRGPKYYSSDSDDKSSGTDTDYGQQSYDYVAPGMVNDDFSEGFVKRTADTGPRTVTYCTSAIDNTDLSSFLPIILVIGIVAWIVLIILAYRFKKSNGNIRHTRFPDVERNGEFDSRHASIWIDDADYIPLVENTRRVSPKPDIRTMIVRTVKKLAPKINWRHEYGRAWPIPLFTKSSSAKQAAPKPQTLLPPEAPAPSQHKFVCQPDAPTAYGSVAPVDVTSVQNNPPTTTVPTNNDISRTPETFRIGTPAPTSPAVFPPYLSLCSPIVPTHRKRLVPPPNLVPANRGVARQGCGNVQKKRIPLLSKSEIDKIGLLWSDSESEFQN